MTSVELYQLLQQTVDNFNNDNEKDSYVLLNLIQKINIDPLSDEKYALLYAYLTEIIDMFIDELPIDEEYFSEEISEVITNIEAIQNKMEYFASKSFDEQFFLYGTPTVTL
jgi:hypothetical protein